MGLTSTYSPGPISLTVASDRSGKWSGSFRFCANRKSFKAFESGSVGKVVPRPWASSTMRSQRLGVRTMRRMEATPASSKVRAMTPLAATMNSSISEVARFFCRREISTTSSASITGRVSMVSRSSAPCWKRPSTIHWAAVSWSFSCAARSALAATLAGTGPLPSSHAPTLL